MSLECPRHPALHPQEQQQLPAGASPSTRSGERTRDSVASPGAACVLPAARPRKPPLLTQKETGHSCPLLVRMGLRQDSVQESLRRKDSDFVVTCPAGGAVGRGRSWTHWPCVPGPHCAPVCLLLI